MRHRFDGFLISCVFVHVVESLNYKRVNAWAMNPWLVIRKQMKCTVVNSREVFLTLTHKHTEDSKQSPLSEKCLRLCIEQSCMGMSSVWITLGSQTHGCSRLHLPLPFTSSLQPPVTSWRSACLYIMSNTKDWSAIHKKSWCFWASCMQYTVDSFSALCWWMLRLVLLYSHMYAHPFSVNIFKRLCKKQPPFVSLLIRISWYYSLLQLCQFLEKSCLHCRTYTVGRYERLLPDARVNLTK